MSVGITVSPAPVMERHLHVFSPYWLSCLELDRGVRGRSVGPLPQWGTDSAASHGGDHVARTTVRVGPVACEQGRLLTHLGVRDMVGNRGRPPCRGASHWGRRGRGCQVPAGWLS